LLRKFCEYRHRTKLRIKDLQITKATLMCRRKFWNLASINIENFRKIKISLIKRIWLVFPFLEIILVFSFFEKRNDNLGLMGGWIFPPKQKMDQTDFLPGRWPSFITTKFDIYCEYKFQNELKTKVLNDVFEP
jgi:hypothetical protein